jgi:ELWxxDGT repeat protein
VAYFSARDGVHGAELWRSDGREGGTFLVHDMNPGPFDSSLPYMELTSSGPFMFFNALGPFGIELSATDLLFKDGVEQGP